MKNRFVRTPSFASAVCLCLSVALLAGCATRRAGVARKAPAASAAVVAPEAALDKNEIIIDKPGALKADTAGLMASITPQQQIRIAQAIKASNSDPTAQALLVQATPKMRSFIERLSCIRQYNDGGTAALQALAGPGVSFKFFVPPMHGTKNHNKANCLTVTSVIVKPASTQVKAGGARALNALQIKVTYVAEDSGESTTSNHEINKNAKGVWWFTR